jgi:hypothetical protein
MQVHITALSRNNKMNMMTVSSLATFALVATGASAYVGTATFYEGIGGPISACGVPTTKLGDLPFVALNENSIYSSGKNCGRWVKITLGDNCAGGSNSAFSVCNGGCAFPVQWQPRSFLPADLG